MVIGLPLIINSSVVFLMLILPVPLPFFGHTD